jgi:hypothetical protein
MRLMGPFAAPREKCFFTFRVFVYDARSFDFWIEPFCGDMQKNPIKDFVEVKISSRKNPRQRGVDDLLDRLLPGAG